MNKCCSHIDVLFFWMTQAVAPGYSSNRFILDVTVAVAVAVAVAVTTTHPMAVIMSHSCLVENYTKPTTIRTKYSKMLKIKSLDSIHNTHHLCVQFRIDRIISTIVKVANTSNCSQVYLFSQNKQSFNKFHVITACYEDIYNCYCITKSNNNHFHP